MGTHFRAVLSVLAASSLLGAFSCAPRDGGEDGSPATYLVIAPASRQPDLASLGVIVLLQQRGGERVRLEAQGGQVILAGGGPDASVSDALCIPAPASEELYFFNVVPAKSECLLYATLLANAPDAGNDCTGSVLVRRVLVVGMAGETLPALDAAMAIADAGHGDDDAGGEDVDAGAPRPDGAARSADAGDLDAGEGS
jgi:hypothetical protein